MFLVNGNFSDDHWVTCLDLVSVCMTSHLGCWPTVDYVYMGCNNLTIDLILNKTAFWLRCSHELLVEYSSHISVYMLQSIILLTTHKLINSLINDPRANFWSVLSRVQIECSCLFQDENIKWAFHVTESCLYAGQTVDLLAFFPFCFWVKVVTLSSHSSHCDHQYSYICELIKELL